MCELLGMSANVPTDICLALPAWYSVAEEPGHTRMGGELPFMKVMAVAHLKIRTRASTLQLPA